MSIKMAKINSDLRNYTLSLIPDDEYLKSGNRFLNQVLELLKTESNFNIASCHTVGSVGKKTSILHSDFDKTVFINDVEPSAFKAVLENFNDLIRKNAKALRVNIKTIQLNSRSIQFESNDGISVDLLPAANYADSHLRKEDRIKEQLKEVKNRINHKNFLNLSTSLSELYLDFFKRQSEFTHLLIRLTKSWYKSLDLGSGPPIYGIKTVLELISVAVGSRAKKSFYTAFHTFLNYVVYINNIHLDFRKSGKPRIRLISFASGNHGGSFIMDPINPFNNLASNFEDKDDEIFNLQMCATNMKSKLRKAFKSGIINNAFV